MAAKGRILPLVLAGLLLFAQHAAFTHALWHASADLGHRARHDLRGADSNTSGKHAPDSGLCAQHFSLAQVLGAAGVTATALKVPAPDAAPVAQHGFRYRHVAFVVPQSRSPPVFS